MRFSDSAVLTAISASALASSARELLVDLRLGLGGDPVRLVARLGERGVVGGLGLLGPPLQERRLSMSLEIASLRSASTVPIRGSATRLRMK